MPKVDFTNIPDMELVTAGWYTATIIKAEAGVSNAGNDKIDLQFQINGGEFDKRLIFDTLVWADKALWRLKQSLQALGFKKDFKGDVKAEDLIGKACEIRVKTEVSTQVDDAGEPYPDRNRISRMKPISAGSGKNLF